jgi:phosphoribosyl-AMP cyclohydrolase
MRNVLMSEGALTRDQATEVRGLDPAIAARLKRDPAGLIAAIAQQYDTGEVLMLGWMNDEALHRTLTTGR